MFLILGKQWGYLYLLGTPSCMFDENIPWPEGIDHHPWTDTPKPVNSESLLIYL